MCGEHREKPLTDPLGQHHVVELDRWRVQVGALSRHLLALAVEPNEAVEHTPVEGEAIVGQVIIAARVRLAGEPDEAFADERAGLVKVDALLDLLVEGSGEHLQHPPHS